jgi:hypothetical protein
MHDVEVPLRYRYFLGDEDDELEEGFAEAFGASLALLCRSRTCLLVNNSIDPSGEDILWNQGANCQSLEWLNS